MNDIPIMQYDALRVIPMENMIWVCSLATFKITAKNDKVQFLR